MAKAKAKSIIIDKSNQEFTYTDKAETITVTGSDNKIYTKGGKDKITLSGGKNNVIDAGSGADTIVINKSANSGNKIYGGADGDKLIVSAGSSNFLYGGAGNDTITISKGSGKENMIYGQDGKDKITVSAGSSHTVDGGAGDDTIKIAKGAGTGNMIYGQAGNDKITVSAGGSHTVDGGAGNDTITIAKGSGDSIKISGQDGTDTIKASAGASHTIDGGAGNDKITISAGSSHTVDGGAGNDTIAIAKGSGSGNTVYGQNGNDTIKVSAGSSHTIKGDAGNDKITVSAGSSHTVDGGAGNDTITIAKGSGNSNKIYGQDGTDTIKVSAGKSHTIDGGAGNDTITIAKGSGSGSTINGQEGADTITVNVGKQTVYGGAGNDKITIAKGAAEGNAIYGEAGADTITVINKTHAVDGGADNDTITVTGGNKHVLRGGTGSDKYVINAKIAKSTVFNLNQSDFTNNDADTLQLSKVKSTEVDYSFNGGTLTIKHKKNKGQIIISGWDKNPLSKILFSDKKSMSATDINKIVNPGNVENVININKNGTYNATAFADTFRFSGTGWTATIVGATNQDNLDFSQYKGDYGWGDIKRSGNDLKMTFLEYNDNYDEGEKLVGTLTVKNYFTSTNRIEKVTAYDSDEDFYGHGQKVLRTFNMRIDQDATAGDDLLLSLQGKAALNGGAGNDFIWGGSPDNVLHGGDGNDIIEGNEGNDKIYGDAGDDALYGDEGNNELHGGSGNDILKVSAGGANKLYGEDGNDKLYVSGEKDVLLDGGKGSDVYNVAYIYSYTDLQISQSTHNANDADVLYLTNVNRDDVAFSLQNGALTISHKNGGKITVAGWDVNPLNKIVFVDGKELTATDITNELATEAPAVTQQSVIKTFMNTLDNYTVLAESWEDGTLALNAAVSKASNGKYGTWNSLVESFISDVNTYGKKDNDSAVDYTYHGVDKQGYATDIEPESGLHRFLKNYCGIDLTNGDTGSIIGSDAGGAEVKTAISIVPENGTVAALQSPESATTTINGLTFHWPDVGNDTTKQYIINSLYTWWAEEGLNLVDEAYGLSFTEKGVTGKDMNVEFVNVNETFMAKVDSNYSYKYSGSGANKFITSENTALTMKINMKYFKDIDTTDPSGYAGASSGYLDRTIAHEFTHAIMAAAMERVNGWLPLYLKEGLAELVHGIDDVRPVNIISLARSTNTEYLSQVLQPNMLAGNDTYAAGYMLLRYFAKQVADAGSGQVVNTSSNVISTLPDDVTGMLVPSSAIFASADAMTASDYSENCLADTSVRNALIDFADSGISDFQAGTLQEDKQNSLLFVTGNV